MLKIIIYHNMSYKLINRVTRAFARITNKVKISHIENDSTDGDVHTYLSKMSKLDKTNK